MTPRLRVATITASSLLLGAALVGAPAAAAVTTPAVTTPAAAAAPAAAPSFDAPAAVEAWYQQFLGRSAAADPGSRYWVDQLASNPPAQVLARLLATPEHVGATVDGYYTSYLGREPDRGAGYWKDGVAAGRFPLEWAVQNIIGSQEFAARASSGGGTDLDVAQAWYATILGRQGAPGEIAYWAGRLGGRSPLQVVREIWYTPEAVTGRIADHYRYFLGRDGGDGGIGYWYGPEVAGDDAVQVAFATSAEYLADPPDDRR